MTKRMLIDSTHSEETRVAVMDGNKLDDFEVETSTRKQIKGNIYLAKIIRVEPSLQAAFLDYGGNRHGFLPFNEIHPDYYQIPIADKENLLKSNEFLETEEILEPENSFEKTECANNQENTKDSEDYSSENSEPEDIDTNVEVISVASDYEDLSDLDPEKPKKHSFFKKYKIQEVIKRNQVMLVEITKEERGNKGAAMTTYLSLPGRYCVLMPNSGRDGGVSRKITNLADRKRLKSIIQELPTTDDMAIIVRTAGKDRSKIEITRDYDYLIKTWNTIREETLKSKAPVLIYEEGNLIKRSIRDIYSKDIDEIIVEGDNGYRIAKDFMKTITPSHAKKVKQYKEKEIPLFQRYQIENQLENLHSPTVQLDSGGYLVINQTEALVAIDVNSGRSTKERNIEDTALRTNLEAADEIARQLRLRNLAGLVVIDFIDMEEVSNNHTIERRIKDALKRDRARIQIGRISGFGLMEISRQRIHSSFLESSYTICPHCKGKGLIRSTESSAIFMVRIIEEEALRKRATRLIMHVPVDVAIYILNYKRENIRIIEQRYNIEVIINGDQNLLFSSDYRMDREKTENEPTKEIEKKQNKISVPEKPLEKEIPVEKELGDTPNNKPKKNKNNKRKNFNKQKNLIPVVESSEIKTESPAEEKTTENLEKTPEPEKNTRVFDKNKSKRGGLRNLRKRHNSKFREKTVPNPEKNTLPNENGDSSSGSVIMFNSHANNQYEKTENNTVNSEANNNEESHHQGPPKKGWWQKLMN